MMILLDTCCLFWMTEDPSRLSADATRAVVDPANDLVLSAITGFEIGYLHRKGEVSGNSEAWLDAAIARFGIRVVALDWRLSLRSTLLPDVHRDSADRMIVATALSAGVPIVTPDSHIRQYPGVRVIW